MEWLFGKKKTVNEMLRENQRLLNRAMRDLDRERAKMEQQEKKVIADIKKMAKQGQMDAVKVMAKDLVRTKRYVKKFIMMRANIQAVSLKLTTLKSQSTMADAMKGVTKAMMRMNKQMKLPQMQKIMQEFEKQSEMMDMKGEMMEDAIDDAMGDADDDEESDQIVAQVLDELGLQLADELTGLPSADGALVMPKAEQNKPTAVSAGGPSNSQADDVDADLEARLNNLKRD
ncbi:charged multivesicular body protein 2a-like [Styela clava]|uniref:charged multivesicular body protein 2a-like n=1 Tax=Styela clava TaxID=7725 RepID=UPI001939F31A|nr:charged multivesicular body protein 2a-like [Styela clava]